MSVSIYNKTDNKLSPLANQTELMDNDSTADITRWYKWASRSNKS